MLTLSQKSYIESILHCFNLNELKPISMPMDPSTKLSVTQSSLTATEYTTMHHIPYQEAVGLLMYAALRTRPDISYAISQVSCFTSNYDQAHWDAVKRVYHYLSGTKSLQLTYGGGENPLMGYTNTDGSVIEDCHAILGYAFLINGGAVS